MSTNTIQGTDLELMPWDTPLGTITNITMHMVNMAGVRRVEASFVDLNTNICHIFRFDRVLACRVTDTFDVRYLGNSFIVCGSQWLQQLTSKCMRPASFMQSARHLILSSMDGVFEVVCLNSPEYGFCAPDLYRPFTATTSQMSEG